MDSHVTEPPDAWTARVAQKYPDNGPHAGQLVTADDPFSVHPREQCTVGALLEEAKGRDVSIVSRRTVQYEQATVGDFVKTGKCVAPW